ncbi:hypothetical protein O6H91_03G092700 [Diphasiastrum complanatum]|uniref:Uncharacterized protein n=2 Tax=Diphasiastrum complanatum TaxID=34168 RepID=A0ACC2E928_DIPCM|nr:hypothetical protein O6H91_03G065600 [Diphasiastrum complanatum]KAJ7563004.1 hypothetical protein O6H91_03G092700 [Diphasiastrum complanatum]
MQLHRLLSVFVKKHPCLCGVVILAVLIVIAWSVVLKPQRPVLSVERISIHTWNISEDKVGDTLITLLTSSLTLQLNSHNRALCWRLRYQDAHLNLFLHTNGFKYPLADAQIPEFSQPVHSHREMLVNLEVVGKPLYMDAQYTEREGRILKLSVEAIFHATPHARWFWLPFGYRQPFNCTFSTTSTRKHKLRSLQNWCGFSSQPLLQ